MSEEKIDFTTASYAQITDWFLAKYADQDNIHELRKIDRKWRKLGQQARFNKL